MVKTKGFALSSNPKCGQIYSYDSVKLVTPKGTTGRELLFSKPA
jgi:hypothetical protein